MPLYAYRCTECGHLFEKIQNFSAEPETICPKCGGLLERPLTAPAFNFKGAGWYVNDYASRPSSNSESKSPTEGGPAPAADGKPSTESKPVAESKPAASESTTKPAASSSTPSTT